MSTLLKKMTLWRGITIVIFAAGFYAAYLRFAVSWRAATNMSDAQPWGIWVGLATLCGVALSAGGFAIAAVVHLLGLERYRPVARVAVLVAFLGYLSVCVGYLWELGLPWRAWHPAIYWNFHSVLFDVFMCIMCYTTVLALEFAPIVLERFNLQKPLKWIRGLLVPLVIGGVILSTLHQSSLGSLYLIMPEKLHPFWYSPLLPVFFFISAIAVGLAMTIFESSMSSKYFGRQLELPILQELGRLMFVVLSVFAILRFEDLLHRGMLKALLRLGYEMYFFWLEVSLSLIFPLVLLARKRVRQTAGGLYLASVLVVLGFITNRLNVSITGLESAAGMHYVPRWTEIAVTGAIMAAGFALFGIAAKYLPIFPAEPETRTHLPDLQSLTTANAVMENAGD